VKSLFTQSDALLSDDGRYRYRLSRVWDDSLPLACWLMLNPSVADHEQDDPTVRRVTGFSQSWGFGGFVVVNLFALRSTDPAELKRDPYPIGPDNDRHIWEATEGRRVIAAWGAGGNLVLPAGRRDLQVRADLHVRGRRLECLGLTKEGFPLHPLRLRADLTPVPFPYPTEAKP
jgi:hypothetical protein